MNRKDPAAGPAGPDLPGAPDGEVNCFACRHFHITYDPRFPYGCRAAGFKSRSLPSREMAANSGMACQFFTLRGRAS